MKILCKLPNKNNRPFINIFSTQMPRKMPSAACLDCDKTFVSDQRLKIHQDFVHCVYSDTQCKECLRVLSNREHLQIHTDFCHYFYVNSNIEPEELSANELISDHNDNCSTSSEEPPKRCKKSNKKNTKKLLINTSKAQSKGYKKLNKNNDKKVHSTRLRDKAEVRQKGHKKSNKDKSEKVSLNSSASPPKRSKNSSNNNSEKVSENALDVSDNEDSDAANFEGVKTGKRRKIYHECKLCGYSTQGVARHDMHMLKEHGIPLSCRICSRVCNSRMLLKKHERIAHSDVLEAEKKAAKVCSQCGKTFSNKFILQTHVRHVHSKKKRPTQVCPVCGLVTSDYKKHMRVHSGEKPFTCKTCGRTFRVSGSLKLHEATHQDVKPFQCELCGNSYRWLKTLNDHRRTMHLGEERFKCNVCGRTFKWDKSLKIHKNSHQIISPAKPEQQQRTSYSEPAAADKTLTTAAAAPQINYGNNNYQLLHQHNSGMFWGLNPSPFSNMA